MHRNIKTTKENIIIYLSVIAACFLFGFIYSAIYKWVNILEWIFVFITAASFFVSGIWLVMKGCFNNITWKIIYVLALPLIYLIDYFLINNIVWYDGFYGAPYYLVFTLGVLLTKIKKNQS